MTRRGSRALLGVLFVLLSRLTARPFIGASAPIVRTWQGVHCRGSRLRVNEKKPVAVGHTGRWRGATAIMPVRGGITKHAMPELELGFSPEWWQVVAAVVTILVGWRQQDIDYRQSRDFKKSEAVKQLMEPFKLPPTASNVVVERTVMDDIKKRVQKWGKDGNGDTTVIAGLAGSGKSTAMEHALKGVRGVLWVPVQEPDWKSQLQQQLGVEGVAT